MSPAELLGAAMLGALVLYALLAGADFGGGIWDLLAAGPREREQRALVETAIGPIWEANHVWLVLVIVVLFTGFPAAFAAMSIGLFVPLVLLLVGIVLRGAAFTFRTYDHPTDRVQARWGLVFSISSVIAPATLGVIVGALASGRVASAETGAGQLEWLAPFPIVVGLFAAALFAYLAATYLVVPGVTLYSASAPRATQVGLLWALAAGGLLLFPSLYLLFRVFKGERPFAVVDRARRR